MDQWTYLCLETPIGRYRPLQSGAKEMTRNIRHLDLAQPWLKEKVADGTCAIEKIDLKEKNSDIGTKRACKILFEELSHNLINKS